MRGEERRGGVAGDVHLQIVLPQVVKGQAFCSSLPLIVATPLSNAVDVAPVLLLLWVL